MLVIVQGLFLGRRIDLTHVLLLGSEACKGRGETLLLVYHGVAHRGSPFSLRLAHLFVALDLCSFECIQGLIPVSHTHSIHLMGQAG